MRQSGFTLLELSIVLVIIGLIIGGVTVGSSMIRQAQLQTVLKDSQGFYVAINTFKLKFGQLPGDMPNGSAYWPSCALPTSGCDGNRDGLINFTHNGNYAEHAMAWRHLSLSSMLKGTYDGQHHSDLYIPNVNMPPSSIAAKGAWYLGHTDVYNKTTNAFWIQHENDTDGIMNSGEAYAIDSKLDDGQPGYGKVWTINANRSASGCVNADTNTVTGQYQLGNEDMLCAVIFIYNVLS